MGNARQQILEAACSLMERQGYHGSGLNEIIKVSGAPRGSLYYYFPEGKEELVEQAIELRGGEVAGRIRTNLAAFEDPAEAVRVFIHRIADSLEATQFSTGGPLTAVAMETASSSPRLNLACRAAFGEIQAAFAGKLFAAGLAERAAQDLALFIVAAIEGGVLLSRTGHSSAPLRLVADQLSAFLSARLSERPLAV